MNLPGVGAPGVLDNKTMALDSRGLENLKTSARAEKGSEQHNAAIDKVAKQFESVFLQWALKSMREATPEGGLFTDSATKNFQSMYDQELVQHLSGKGLGLSTEIARQLKSMSQAPMAPTADLSASTLPQAQAAAAEAAAAANLNTAPSTLRQTGR